MENYPIPITNSLKNTLLESFVPPQASENDRFEVIIKMEAKSVSVRQFAAYLNFIDRSYGRFTPEGILSYSRSKERELKITQLRPGSLEFVLSNYLANPISVTALILVGLLLKYLPGIIKSTLSAYRDYEEGKLAKVRRQQIKEQMKRDGALNKLNDRKILQLSKLFDAIYGLEIRNVPKAHKFSVETIIEVRFNVNRSGGVPTDQEQIRKVRFHRSIDL